MPIEYNHPTAMIIFGLSRKELSDQDYQKYVADCISSKIKNIEVDTIKKFSGKFRYSCGNFSDLPAYEKIKEQLLAYDNEIAQCTSKLFYLAVPPNLYSDIFTNLEASGAMELCDGQYSWSRILVEKPFGSDLHTAKELEKQLCQLFDEDQIYRIDHYLAKDAIENIISLRSANSILADSWNGDKIESITIRLLETQDLENRGNFYDGIGTLRDVGQNHMLQILALLTMDLDDALTKSSIREKRTKAVQSLKMHDTDLRQRGQYQGYREVAGVSPQSDTETYFKIETHIDSDIWRNVKVTLEAGKALNQTIADVVIVFRSEQSCGCNVEKDTHKHQNKLTITFSPKHSIQLTMWLKAPGLESKLSERNLVLADEVTKEFRSLEAYERVLYDCILGNQSRFVSGKEVEVAWNFITPILESFKKIPLLEYPKGSQGPLINQS